MSEIIIQNIVAELGTAHFVVTLLALLSQPSVHRDHVPAAEVMWLHLPD